MKKRIVVIIGVIFIYITLFGGYAVSSIAGEISSYSAAAPAAAMVIDESTQAIMPASSAPALSTEQVSTSTSAATDETSTTPTVPSEAPASTATAQTASPSTAAPSKKTAATKPAEIKPSTTAPAVITPPTAASATPSKLVLDSLMGKSESYITGQFGNPAAKEKSEYGFYWYVYHKNYSGLIMIGIQNNTVVGLYSNSSSLQFENMTVGAAKSTVRNALGAKYTGPLTSIRKGGTEFTLAKTDQRDVFQDSQKYITVFYDNTLGGSLTAVQIIGYATEQNFDLLPDPDSQTAESYEKISFYLINSIRVRFNKPVLQYDNNMARVAAAHSEDMIRRSFFSHTNPDGQDPASRIHAAGYTYRSYAENIAKDHPGAISAHESYMNNTGHRTNILGNYCYVGIGVGMAFESVLLTQVFITYP